MGVLDIAIVGMACRLPASNSLKEFWNNLCQDKECLTRFSEAELIAAGIPLSLIENPNFVPVKGVLTNVDQFDASFFGLTPIEASIMDPQQRLFLECAWEALEHSNNVPNKCQDKPVSVYAGMSDSCYLQENLLKNRWFRQHYDWLQARVATSIGTLSTQLSYRLNLKGRSVSLNTACSTGLVAVAHACEDLLLGNSDLALAGAVAIELPQVKGYLCEAGGIHSADGYCRPFSHNANGTVFSNGVGVIVLKRLADAIADKDTIYAVVKGCAVNNDGSDKLNYFAPSINGQAACIQKALMQADISAEDIDFMEAHGTATSLGDLVEVTALTQIYRQYSEKKQYCVLGSVKGNIGHTDIAAGIASLIKVALCLYHQKIPATLHFDQPNPHIDYINSPFYVNKQLMFWPSSQNQRYAAVSAFGIGGTNSHLILSEYRAPKVDEMKLDSLEQLLIVSAKTQTALQKSMHNVTSYLDDHRDESIISLEKVAYTLQKGRDDFRWRGMAVGKDIHELTKALGNAELKECPEEEPNVVFMFPGQGSQYTGMAFHLYKQFPSFAQYVDQCSQIVKQHLAVDIREIMFGVSIDPRLSSAAYAQVALFIIEYALAQLLMSWGIKPAAVIGHSSGEYVAACVAGIFLLEDALFLICQRGRLMESTEPGAMLAITCTMDDFTDYSRLFSVELAAHNAIQHCVATGTVAAITELKQYVEQQGKACQMLKVNHAFHSQWMEPILSPFQEIVNQVQLSPPRLPLVSNLTGDLLTAEMVTSDYWGQHLRRPVQFKRGIDALVAHGYTFFIEIGPGQTLRYFVEGTVATRPGRIEVIHTLPVATHKEMDYSQVLAALGVAWQNGATVNWSALYGQKQLQSIELPAYPFERQHHWLEADMIGPNADILEHTIPEIRFFQPTWLRRAAYVNNIGSIDICQLTWIIFKNETGLGDLIISDLQEYHVNPIVIEAGDVYRRVNSQHYIINIVEKTHYMHLFLDLKNKISGVPIIIHLFSCHEEGNGFLTNKQIENQLNRGFYSVLYLTQAYIEKIDESSPLKCAVITECSQQVLGDDDLRPINATLTGICRVIKQEHPSFKFQLIDINPENSGNNFHNLSKSIIKYCIQEKWDTSNPIIAFRQGFQWKLDYMGMDLNQKQNNFRSKGIYLVTGGLGDISLKLCEKILKTIFQPTFILLTRSVFPPSSKWEEILKNPKQENLHNKIKQLQKLLELGAILSIKQVDITESESVQSVIQETLRNYGQLNGVIHAAGVPGGGLIQLKTFDKAQSVLSPKVQGTYYLAEALKNVPIDFIALCSSVSALVGEPGQIDYCSANACLDAFAASHLFYAPVVVSINWNTWKDVGMAVKTVRPQGLPFLDIGNDITPEQGQEIFMQIMQNNYPQVAVSMCEITALTKLISDKNQESIHVGIDRKDLNIKTPHVPSSNAVEMRLLQLWENALGIRHIGIEDDFFDLGGHSLCALGLINKINKAFNCWLTIQDLYTMRTVSKLLARIIAPKQHEIDNIWVQLHVGQSEALNIFLFPPVSGMLPCYNKMLSSWELPYSIYGFQDSGIINGQLVFNDLMEMVKACCVKLQKVQPHGPYYLIGYSFGATLAYEMAHLLQQQGEKVELLAMIDGWAVFSPDQYLEKPFKEMTRHYYPDLSSRQIDLSWVRMQLLLHHRPSQTQLDTILFKAEHLLEEYQHIDEPYNGWRRFNSGRIIRKVISANHESIMNEINGIAIARYLKNLLVNVGNIVE